MTTFTNDQLVKYSNPLNEKEAFATFKVLDVIPANGNLKEKLKVEFICDMNIKPVSIFFSSEFVAA